MLLKIYKSLSIIFIKYSTCIYYPSCSEYAYESIKKYGVYGLIKSLKRLLRCNFFFKGGVDLP